MSSVTREQFEHEGYVVVPEFAAPRDCERLRTAALDLAASMDLRESVFDAGGQEHGNDPWFLESGGEVRAFLEPERDPGPDGSASEARVNKLGHALHDRSPEFRRFSRDPRLAALVARVAPEGMEPLLLQSMVIFKHPRVGGEVPAHQDATYLYTEPASVLGLWFALEPASRDNGCLEVLPGGHRVGLKQRYRRTGAGARTEVLDPSPWPEQGWVPLEVDTGTLVIFHGLLPHRSTANRSPRSRVAYTLHLIDARAHYPADNWLQRPADMPLRGF